MFTQSLSVTGLALIQILLLGAIGFFLVKKNILGPEGLSALSRLVVEITLPLLIFCQLIKDFRFTIYPNWWLFPLLSIAVNLAGLMVGLLFGGFIKGEQHRAQFLSLVIFQNSGYLPLALIAALLPKDRADTMFIYLFLFLLGFNLLIWSCGVYLLSISKARKLELASFFSPPVVATIVSLIVVFFNLNRLLPDFIIRPLRTVGDCTLPLAMLVVGGNLASIRLEHIDKKAVFLISLAKLIILPLLGLAVVARIKPAPLVGLLVMLQLAMPPATSLSLIIRHYKKEDLLISQAVFIGHILSILTIPLFLTLYFMLG